LWEVLRSAEGRCRPEDIIVAYMLASGVPVGEVSDLLGVSRNTPANALRRVGRELRVLLGLDSRAEGEA
jgi:DNA-binding CsgD family transcriptional regulator